ncbi:uncharacterized protein B0P05DRAFT_558936 [Gilbertella persicaria]|uniref:uncharacterized protein n=1 Tax=Gilbertella persicaria TaxID=101096 RepID=UPI0022210B50|nr:uncharacterized protein B0P05DRAFT_558936 [Gilbertella persicaria]KAI8059063.1 hypothetical protein B0P05DRAFT_558936 [Gilbertella persicaria]
MVSFQCDGCGDIVKKPKLNQHGGRCHATFTCIDCSVTFQGNSYQSHTSCMTEAQKFQKHVYQNKNAPVKGNNNNKNSKPVSLIDQLNEKKKNEENNPVNEKKRKNEEKEPKKQKKSKLTAWSPTELDENVSTSLKLALKEVLKEGKSTSLKDARKKTIELIKQHPQSEKIKSDLKKDFDKTFNLTLKDNSITFA